jgi:RNA polymerase sigma factor (sigma-70 family)
MLDKTLADPAPFSRPDAEELVLDTLTDSQLLERFVRRREEAAFAALVRRHGPMVLSVCRRVLCHSHDAEDAFQATFLVLAEKAHRLRRPELLANWLYGVAYRTALHARQRAARRSAREKEAATMLAPLPDREIDTRELRRVLDEELHRLPEKYRAPLVLCYLEGKTNEEAARLLGWPSGSMSHRLARGRELLRERLQVRLAALSILLPMVSLADYLQPAVVPPLLARVTVQAAVSLAAGKMASLAMISPSVRDLLAATLRRPKPFRLSWLLAALLLALTFLGFAIASDIASSNSENASGSCPSASSP